MELKLEKKLNIIVSYLSQCCEFTTRGHPK